MNKRVKQVKFYQSINLGRETITSWAPDDMISDAAQKKGIELDVLDNGVQLHSKNYCTFVPFANVAYVSYTLEEPKQAEASKATEASKKTK
jgi:hypothetical protein